MIENKEEKEEIKGLDIDLEPEDGGLFDDPSLIDRETVHAEKVKAAMEVPFDKKVEKAIQTLKEYEKMAIEHDEDNGYYLCFSGGKDSVVINRLAEMAGVSFDAHHSLTTIDPPEVMRFMKEHHPDLIYSRPEEHFFKMVEKKIAPTRHGRWCCEIYKEGGGEGKVKIVGVRVAESARRYSMWKVLTRWENDDTWCVCPILYWSDADIWKFIHDYNVPYCKLYDEGFKRLGCVGCPLGSHKKRAQEFKQWPRYEASWRKALDVYWENHHDKLNQRGKPYYVSKFKSKDEYWDWWMNGDQAGWSQDADCDAGLFT
jgi:phosphoadenosine phosphosulfate reductase